MIHWNDEYLLGISLIDEQHKKLFSIVEEGFDLLKNDFYIDKYDRIIKLIEELRDYTIFHFRSEEEYMRSINYKKYFSHIIEHQEFINKVNNLDLSKIDKNQDEYIKSILNFALQWIIDHILKTDKLIIQ